MPLIEVVGLLREKVPSVYVEGRSDPGWKGRRL